MWGSSDAFFKLSTRPGKWPASHPSHFTPWGEKCLVASEEGAGWGPEPGWACGR